MKKLFIILVFCFFTLGLVSCSEDDTIEVEATIIDKYVQSGVYYFSLEYELEGFFEPLTAIESVRKSVYGAYEIGDTYIFKRPKPQLDN